MKTKNIRIGIEAHRLLKIEAAKNNCSLSEMISLLLKECSIVRGAR